MPISTPKCWCVENIYIFFFLDTRQLMQYLYQTRFRDPRDAGHQAEAEPSDGDEESFLWIMDSGSEFGDEDYPRTNHASNRMEVDGHDAGGDDATAGMFPAEADDEVRRPRRHVRNIIASDDDGNDDGNADDSSQVDPEHPPGTMAVFDEIAPMDANNPCEFSLLW